ncbi:MAG TPA: hypothetical protein DDY43_14860 [Synechococcales bacterium UBA10510]|nr:hypothetical protein [Synechococcales bacterium UBA10510]
MMLSRGERQEWPGHKFFEAVKPGQKLRYWCIKNSLAMLVIGKQLKRCSDGLALARAWRWRGRDAGEGAMLGGALLGWL